MLVKLAIPPGVVRLGTQYQSAGRWFDMSLVRWNQGAMKPIGGWAARTTTPLTGKARAMLTWRDNSSVRWIVVGTHSKLYALTQSAVAGSDITPAGFTTGSADATAAGGYGGGAYGAAAYGTARVDTTTIQDATMWTMDTFGQNWYGVSPDDGYVYKWQLDTGVAAAALGGTAPTANKAIVVTPERFIFVLGAANVVRRVQWADQESDSTWTASATNQAGDFDIQSQGRLMCGKRLRNATVLFTDLDAHIAEYIGYPYIYRFTRVGENCGIASRGAAAASDARVYWMGINGFYVYDGVVQPLPCDVYDYVFGDINLVQRSKITATLISQFNEVWWFYASAASTENDRAVAYNYVEGTWMIHTLARTCASDRGVFTNPIMCTADGYLYDHETGSTYTGASPSTPFAKVVGLEIGDGERIMKVRELIPDEATQGDVAVTFYTKDSPNGAETTHGPFTMDDFVNVHFAARQADMKVSGNVATSWRWGNPRLEGATGGRR